MCICLQSKVHLLLHHTFLNTESPAMSGGSRPCPDGPPPSGFFEARPWLLFGGIWTAAMGYAPAGFLFIPGETPMSTAKETAIGIMFYYSRIYLAVVHEGWSGFQIAVFVLITQPLPIHAFWIPTFREQIVVVPMMKRHYKFYSRIKIHIFGIMSRRVGKVRSAINNNK